MFENILYTIGATITAVVVAVTGFFNPAPPDELILMQNKVESIQQEIQELQDQIDKDGLTLGSFNPTGGKTYRLFGSGITSSANTLILTSFKMPISDQEWIMANFGEIYYGMIEPNNPNNLEIISFTGITQDGSTDKATLTGVSRGLSFTAPYNASTTLRNAHSGGSRFILSNPPPFYKQFAKLLNDELIWGDWTYSATNTPQYNEAPSFTSASNEFASVAWTEGLTNQGGATSTEIQSGIVELGDSSELGTSVAKGSTGGSLVLQNRFATSSCEVATSSIPVTGADGKLAQGCLDLDEEWIFSENIIFSATTTHNATTSLNEYTTISDILIITASTTQATTTFGVAPYSDTDASADNQLTRKTQFTDFIGVREARNTNQTYVASTSAGFVVYSETLSTGSGTMTIFTSDGDATTTLAIVRLTSTIEKGTITIPIAKNQQWMATTTAASAITATSLFFIPLLLQ